MTIREFFVRLKLGIKGIRQFERRYRIEALRTYLFGTKGD